MQQSFHRSYGPGATAAKLRPLPCLSRHMIDRPATDFRYVPVNFVESSNLRHGNSFLHTSNNKRDILGIQLRSQILKT